MKLLQLIIILIFIMAAISTGHVQAIVSGKITSANDWRSVVLIELVDPSNGQRTSCTGVIISDRYAITTASCVLHKESAKQVSKVKICIGQRRPFKDESDHCFESDQIYTHHKFINSSLKANAYNLAYIHFDKALNLTQLKIKPATLLTPKEFSNLIGEGDFPEISWVGYDSKDLVTPALGIKQYGQVKSAEFDYNSLSIKVTSTDVRPGNRYQGMASFIKTVNGEWRLIGLVSQSNPDNVISYYPEVNPCDEDPVIVRYPKPIMQVVTTITPYPVAACEMLDFVIIDGYELSSCSKLMASQLSLSEAVENLNPNALRQQALLSYQSNHSRDDAGEVYKRLYQALNQGDQLALVTLAELLVTGELFEQDLETANQLIADLVKENHPEANLLLAKIMLFENDNYDIIPSTETRDKQILTLLETSAKAGLADAQYLVAKLYQLGIGAKQNHRKAYHWYAMSAMQGNADGQFQLGMQWADGRGVRPYLEVSQFWIQQAAAQGHIDAQNRLGMLKPVVEK